MNYELSQELSLVKLAGSEILKTVYICSFSDLIQSQFWLKIKMNFPIKIPKTEAKRKPD